MAAGIFDPGIFDLGIFDTDALSDPSVVDAAPHIYINGVLQTGLVLDNHQFLDISFGSAAYDGEIGQGTITVPGDRPWTTGDRMTWKEGAELIYTGWVHSPVVRRNPARPLEMETTYRLWDPNRLFYGIITSDDVPIGTGPFSLDALTTATKNIVETLTATADTTYALSDSTPTVPDKLYNSDGATDFIADIVSYWGYTVFLNMTDTENAFHLHVEALGGLQLGGLTISDVPAAVGGNTFAPQNPQRLIDSTDLKDGIYFKNGVDLVPVGTTHAYEGGGIGFRATLQYNVDQVGLDTIASNVSSYSLTEPTTYTTTIGPMLAGQVRLARVGTLLYTTAAVFGGELGYKIVRHLTLTISRDQDGEPMPGYWDAALEMGAAMRSPTAVRGSGLLGSSTGALGTFTQWTKTVVTEDDPAIPVGSSETVQAQLVDEHGDPVPVEGVELTWAVLQADRTTAHPDYSTLDIDTLVAASTSTTDISGAAYIIVKRNANTMAADHSVSAGP